MGLLDSYLAVADDIKFAPRLIQEWKSPIGIYVQSNHWDLELGYVDLVVAHKSFRNSRDKNPLRWLKQLENHNKVLTRLEEAGHVPLFDYSFKDLFFVRETETLLVHPAIATLYMESNPTLDLILGDETIDINDIPVHSSTTGLFLVSDWPNRGFLLPQGCSPFARYNNSKWRMRQDSTLEPTSIVRLTRKGKNAYWLVDRNTALNYKEWVEHTNIVHY